MRELVEHAKLEYPVVSPEIPVVADIVQPCIEPGIQADTYRENVAGTQYPGEINIFHISFNIYFQAAYFVLGHGEHAKLRSCLQAEAIPEHELAQHRHIDIVQLKRRVPVLPSLGRINDLRLKRKLACNMDMRQGTDMCACLGIIITPISDIHLRNIQAGFDAKVYVLRF